MTSYRKNEDAPILAVKHFCREKGRYNERESTAGVASSRLTSREIHFSRVDLRHWSKSSTRSWRYEHRCDSVSHLSIHTLWPATLGSFAHSNNSYLQKLRKHKKKDMKVNVRSYIFCLKLSIKLIYIISVVKYILILLYLITLIVL